MHTLLPSPLLPLLTADIAQEPALAAFSPMIGIALATCAMIVILYYLLGKAVSSPQIDAFAKEELSQFVISMLIVAAWFSLYGTIGAILSGAACGSASCDQFSVALYALDIIRYKLLTAYTSFLSIEAVLGFFSSVGFSLPMGSPILAVKWFHISPLGGLGILSNVVVGVTESMGMLLGLVVGREQLLTLFRDMIPAFLLPAGLFMRGLPFTRTTGSSLIAVSFAAFFFFPLSIMFSHYLMFESQPHYAYIPAVPTPTGLCKAPENLPSQMEAWEYLDQQNKEIGNYLAHNPAASVDYGSDWFEFSGFIGDSTAGLGSSLGSTKNFVLQRLSPAFVISAVSKPTTIAYVTYNVSLNYMQGAAQLAVMVAVTFVLEIIITITGYRAIAAAIGGELEILGLTKVV